MVVRHVGAVAPVQPKVEPNVQGSPKMWKGYYIQGNRHAMEILMLVDSNAIYGEGGHDGIGTFDIEGTVTGNDFEFTKKYRGKHNISYHGHFENQHTMVGHWGFHAM